MAVDADEGGDDHVSGLGVVEDFIEGEDAAVEEIWGYACQNCQSGFKGS